MITALNNFSDNINCKEHAEYQCFNISCHLLGGNEVWITCPPDAPNPCTGPYEKMQWRADFVAIYYIFVNVNSVQQQLLGTGMWPF